MQQTLIGRTAPVENSLWAVRFLDPQQLPRDGIQRVVPRDALEASFSSLSDSSLRVFQAIRMVDALAVSAAFEARPKLGLLPLIACDPANQAVPNMYPQKALTAAIVHACRSDNPALSHSAHWILLRGTGMDFSQAVIRITLRGRQCIAKRERT